MYQCDLIINFENDLIKMSNIDWISVIQSRNHALIFSKKLILIKSLRKNDLEKYDSIIQTSNDLIMYCSQ